MPTTITVPGKVDVSQKVPVTVTVGDEVPVRVEGDVIGSQGSGAQEIGLASAPQVTGAMSVTDPDDQYLRISNAMPPLAISVTGGQPPYSFELYKGALPTGIAVVEDTGVILGTPSVAISSTVVQFLISDEKGAAVITGDVTFSVAGELTVAEPGDQALTNGTEFTLVLTHTGGRTPVTWSLFGSASVIPPGLELDASTGVVSGTPTTNGTYPLVFRCTDANGVTRETDSADFVVS